MVLLGLKLNSGKLGCLLSPPVSVSVMLCFPGNEKVS
jgi:hypothetical protein